MSPVYIGRLLDSIPLQANQTQQDEKILDLALYKQLNAAVHVINKGSAGNVVLKHAATKEDEAFIPLETIDVGSTATTVVQYFTFDNFLRYVRWECDGSVAGSPRAVIDLVVKP